VVLAWFLGRQYDKAKYYEKIARLSEKSYKNLLDSLPSTIIIHKDQRVIYVNDLAVTMFRAANREALIGKSTLELVTPKYADQLIKRTKAASSGNKALKSIEYNLKRQDGTTMDFEVSSLKIIFEGVEAVLSIGKDLSNIQICMEYESNIPFVYCDENQLKQVFLNILKNATEAMPNGGNIDLKVKKDKEKGVLIQIIDQGVGIPKERIPTLGDPFYTTKEKGTGLGLMTCYKIIENHQGQLQIDSEVNKGTTVQIFLPSARDVLKETGDQKRSTSHFRNEIFK
jgi:PAS domain S-box-containing protein